MSRFSLTSRFGLALLGWALVPVLFSGCADPIVGADCRPGYRAAADRCVPNDADGGDERPDGAVPDGSFPDGAMPDGGLPDGALPDGGLPDGATPDGGVLDGAVGDGGGGIPDGGGSGCDIGEIECDGTCIRPDTDPDYCGGCDTACTGTDVCAEGMCVPACEAPLSLCGGGCVDLETDEDHCGRCGRSCPSGICNAGMCDMATAGHLVVIGHDYTSSRIGMNRIVGNSVFLARGAPIEVVVWEGEATEASIRGTDRAIAQVASDTGRTWIRDDGDFFELPYQLAFADVFLVYAQHGASDARLAELADAWGRAMRSFLSRGGIIVVLDAPGSNMGTWQLPQIVGIFDATGHTEVSGDELSVVSPGDAVALDVPLDYRGENATVRFDTSETSIVVEHPDGPVVIHRVFRP